MDRETQERYEAAEKICATLPPRQGTIEEWRATLTPEQRDAYDLLLDLALATGTF